MAEPMIYDFILRDKNKPEEKLEYPMQGEDSVCFYRISRAFEELPEDSDADVWLKGRTPVLELLEYHFNEDNVDLSCVTKIMSALFDNCPYKVKWVVERTAVETNTNNCRMVLTNFDKMPRGLFMNKMFCVRNLIRDEASTKAFTFLLDGGVPFNIAAYLGGALELNEGWEGKSYLTLKDYAGYIQYRSPCFAQIVRCMSSNIYCEQKSEPWESGWGYNYQPNHGMNPDGGWYPLPEEICGAVRFYSGGSHLPEGWAPDNLWEMDLKAITELMRFICKEDTITFTSF